MRRFCVIVLISLPAFLAGAFCSAYLSSITSSVFLDMARLSYIDQQGVLAAQSVRDRKMTDAVCHFRNIVTAKESRKAQEKTNWNIRFPIEALLRGWTEEMPSRGLEIDLGLSYGRLARTLEMAGSIPEAEAQYEKATELIRASREKVRKLADDLLASDEVFLGMGVEKD